MQLIKGLVLTHGLNVTTTEKYVYMVPAPR